MMQTNVDVSIFTEDGDVVLQVPVEGKLVAVRLSVAQALLMADHLIVTAGHALQHEEEPIQ